MPIISIHRRLIFLKIAAEIKGQMNNDNNVIAWQQRLQSTLASACNARGEEKAERILCTFEGASAADIVQEAKRLYPHLLAKLDHDDDDDITDVMRKIALPLYEDCPYEPEPESESEDDDEDDEDDEDDDDEDDNDDDDEDNDEDYGNDDNKQTRKRKDMHEPDHDDIRYKIRALKAIFTMLSTDNQTRLRNLIGMEKDGANIDEMREHVIAIGSDLDSIPETHRAALLDLIHYFQH